MNMAIISLFIMACSAVLVFVFDAQYLIFAATVVALIPTILRFGKLSFLEYYKQDEQYKGLLLFTHPLVCFIVFVFTAKLIGVV
jgi:hypothetical protein